MISVDRLPRDNGLKRPCPILLARAGRWRRIIQEGRNVMVVLDTPVNLNASDFVFGDIGFGPPILS